MQSETISCSHGEVRAALASAYTVSRLANSEVALDRFFCGGNRQGCTDGPG